MKKIPLNSLVIGVGKTSEELREIFPSYEVIDHSEIRMNIVGNQIRPDLEKIVNSEFVRLINTKLAFGQRAVIGFPVVGNEKFRSSIARSVAEKGYNVIYFSDACNRINIMSTDSSGRFVESDKKYKIVHQMGDNFFQNISENGFDGVTIVPDIHGQLYPLHDVFEWARSRNHYMLFLGDLVDYGNESIQVVNDVYQCVVRGDAEVIMGNHERKIFRYLLKHNKNETSKVPLTHGNLATIERLNDMSDGDYNRWTNRFKALVNMMRTHRVDGNFIFAHGAVKKEHWESTDYRLASSLEDFSLFGQTVKDVDSDGYPKRIYDWVDDLEKDQIAIVGHDIRSNLEPFRQTGKNGGLAIFMDTGCSKGGHLSTVDISLKTGIPKIENYYLHS